MKSIAILASGSGTNAENIIRYFSDSSLARVTLLLSDNPEAYALQRAENVGVATKVFSRPEFRSGTAVADYLRSEGVDYVVLAGFLSLLSPELTAAYEGRMVNIHPSLLPAHGGKGMYGDRVHEAVIAAGERESGITIHLVDERYDEGKILAQYSTTVLPGDTPGSLAGRIHALEYKYYPLVIEQQIRKL